MECKAVCAQGNFYGHKNKHGGYNGKRHLMHGPELISIIFQMCNICSRVIIVQQKKKQQCNHINMFIYFSICSDDQGTPTSKYEIVYKIIIIIIQIM
jgi:hypothetical protein